MAFNTGNPLGSTDPRDFSDNSENFDRFANGQDAAYTDRFGNQRKSFSGMESEFSAFIAASGYEFVGDYATGITITGYQQVVRDVNGEFWRLDGATNLPYTTTGAGLPEGGSFVTVGDAALRQDLNGALASSLGATIVNGATIYVGSVAELETLSLSVGVNVRLTDDLRFGEGVIKSGTPPVDPLKGIYIPIANGNYWERQWKGYLRAEWFGAVGDGVTDDLDAINAACGFGLTTLKAQASYFISGTILTSKGLIGELGANIVFDTSSADVYAIQAENCRLFGFKVIPSSTDSTIGWTGVLSAMNFSFFNGKEGIFAVQGVDIEAVEARQWGVGLRGNGSYGQNKNTVRNSTFEGGSRGISFFKAEDFIIRGCTVIGGGIGGIMLPSCRRGFVSENKVYNELSTGINPGGSATSNCEDLVISNNTVWATDPLNAENGCIGITIEGNRAYTTNPGNVGTAIGCQNSVTTGGPFQDIVISDNIVIPLGGRTNLMRVGDITTNNYRTTNVTVTGNIIRGTGDGAVFTGVDDFIISDNIAVAGRGLLISKCTSGQIKDNFLKRIGSLGVSGSVVFSDSCEDIEIAGINSSGFNPVFDQQSTAVLTNVFAYDVTSDETNLLANSSSGNDMFISLSDNSLVNRRIERQKNAILSSGASVDLHVRDGSASWHGFMSVVNIARGGPGSYRRTTYSVYVRGTSTVILTEISTDFGGFDAPFSLTVPSNGILRLTNDHTDQTEIDVQIFGGKGF